MAFLESAVVVYLRALYYPGGFVFPLKMMAPDIAITEVIREAATMVMLFSFGMITARNWMSRFAIFIYAFAIWDIFYYVFLFFLLGWPSSFLTWDLLFLIPVVWAGPVLAPVINSVTMIILAAIILFYREKYKNFPLTWVEWLLLITGSVIVIAAYTQPYILYMLSRFSFSEIIHFSRNMNVMEYSTAFIPIKFNWFIYAIGQCLFFGSIAHILIRVKRFY
jgi:hypothetical protein